MQHFKTHSPDLALNIFFNPPISSQTYLHTINNFT
jgi:hypothetical protein